MSSCGSGGHVRGHMGARTTEPSHNYFEVFWQVSRCPGYNDHGCSSLRRLWVPLADPGPKYCNEILQRRRRLVRPDGAGWLGACVDASSQWRGAEFASRGCVDARGPLAGYRWRHAAARKGQWGQLIERDERVRAGAR